MTSNFKDRPSILMAWYTKLICSCTCKRSFTHSLALHRFFLVHSNFHAYCILVVISSPFLCSLFLGKQSDKCIWIVLQVKCSDDIRINVLIGTNLLDKNIRLLSRKFRSWQWYGAQFEKLNKNICMRERERKKICRIVLFTYVMSSPDCTI